MRLSLALKGMLDPLRLFSSLAILGDIFIILSGGYFYNPLRSAAATIGLSTHALGAYWGSKRYLSVAGFRVLSSDIVMGIVATCAVLYFVSGSNILGFEETSRVTEMIIGVAIFTAAICVISGKSHIAPYFFSVGPFFHIFSAFEAGWRQGYFDWFQLGAGLCFLASGIVSRNIKKLKNET